MKRQHIYLQVSQQCIETELKATDVYANHICTCVHIRQVKASAYNKCVITQKLVRRNFEIEWCWTFTDTSWCVIMWAMTRAVVAAGIVTLVRHWHTTYNTMSASSPLAAAAAAYIVNLAPVTSTKWLHTFTATPQISRMLQTRQQHSTGHTQC